MRMIRLAEQGPGLQQTHFARHADAVRRGLRHQHDPRSGGQLRAVFQVQRLFQRDEAVLRQKFHALRHGSFLIRGAGKGASPPVPGYGYAPGTT